MRLLLDTHMLLWATGSTDARRGLPKRAETLIEEAEEVLFSVVSVWEVAIKHSSGRPEFRVDPQVLRRELTRAGYVELAITGEHAAAVAGLPPVHKDPFDRLLVAQAQVEGAVLLTSDGLMGRYGGFVRAV